MISEKKFQQQVIDLAKILGWRSYHTFDSRRSTPGFPDLILLRRTRLIVAELKVGDKKPTKDQEGWLNSFVSAGVATWVWTPNDWKEIERILQ